MLKLAKLPWYFFCVLKVFGSRGGDTEILPIKGVQKCQFLGKSENWTILYMPFVYAIYLLTMFGIYTYVS